MIPDHRRALKISEDLMKISDRNLVHFYIDEIRAGSLKSIPTGARKRLRKAGMVKSTHTRGVSGSGYILTSYGEVLLKEDPEHTKLSMI